MRTGVVAAILVAGMGAAGAQTMIESIDAQAMVELAKGFGSASVENADSPYVTGRIDGTLYSVFFAGCRNDNTQCANFQFHASWRQDGITSEKINGWNASQRFGRAYLDKGGDPVVEMDVNVDYGVTKRNLEDTIDWWRLTMKAFQKEVLGVE